jgi:hypothetical protein
MSRKTRDPDVHVVAAAWLDPRHFRDPAMLEGLGPKTRAAVEALASSPSPTSGALFAAGLTGAEVTRVFDAVMSDRAVLPATPILDTADEVVGRIVGSLTADVDGFILWSEIKAALHEAYALGRADGAAAEKVRLFQAIRKSKETV